MADHWSSRTAPIREAVLSIGNTGGIFETRLQAEPGRDPSAGLEENRYEDSEQGAEDEIPTDAGIPKATAQQSGPGDQCLRPQAADERLEARCNTARQKAAGKSACASPI